MAKKQDPLTADEKLAKIRTREERIRNLVRKMETKQHEVKELRETLEKERDLRSREIMDEPEGELGYDDSKG